MSLPTISQGLLGLLGDVEQMSFSCTGATAFSYCLARTLCRVMKRVNEFRRCSRKDCPTYPFYLMLFLIRAYMSGKSALREVLALSQPCKIASSDPQAFHIIPYSSCKNHCYVWTLLICTQNTSSYHDIYIEELHRSQSR